LAPYMNSRIRFINNEAMTEMSKMSILDPVMIPIKKLAFTPHAIMDAFFAFPTWVGAKQKYLDENPVTSKTNMKRREKLANDYADMLTKQIMGSGHTLDVGSAFTNKSEFVKSFTFMGTFINTLYNMDAHNIGQFKAKKIPWYELLRREGWLVIAAPIAMMALMDDLPDFEDEDAFNEFLAKIVGYNVGKIIGLGQVYQYAISGMDISNPLAKGMESFVDLGELALDLATDERDFETEEQVKMIRALQPAFPLIGSSQLTRTLTGWEDDEQNLWGLLVEGPERN